MVNVLTEIILNCPKDIVSEFASNPDNAPEWYVNINSVVWKTQKPLKIGSEIAFKANFLGKELSYVYKIIEFVPGQNLVMRTIHGPFPMETTYTWKAINENSTLMTLRNKGNPTGFSKLSSPFMSIMMKKANMKDLKKLKNILEN